MASTGNQHRQKENVTQVSTWQFQSLLEAVNKLNNNVMKLEQKNYELSASVSKLELENKALKETVQKIEVVNNGLQDNVSVLQSNCGVFTFFSKLPKKARILIWQFAARTPQVHIISHRRASRSKINSIYNSCSEARQALKELQLDYFILGSEPSHSDLKKQLLGNVRNYINLDIDTVWLNGGEEDQDLPPGVHWICGGCGRNSFADKWNYDDCYCWCGLLKWNSRFCSSSQSGWGPNILPRLAIDCSSWVNPMRAFENAPPTLGTVEMLLMYNVEELLLVVGDLEHLQWQRDFDFVAPFLKRSYVKSSITASEKQGWEDLALQKTWCKSRKDLRNVMRKAKDESYAYGLWEGKLKDWNIPKIRFVEVKARNRDWIIPPGVQEWKRQERPRKREDQDFENC